MPRAVMPDPDPNFGPQIKIWAQFYFGTPIKIIWVAIWEPNLDPNLNPKFGPSPAPGLGGVMPMISA